MKRRAKKPEKILNHIPELRAVSAMLQSVHQASEDLQHGDYDSLHEYRRDELIMDLFAAIEILDKLECR
jgi:hypothetical protein